MSLTPRKQQVAERDLPTTRMRTRRMASERWPSVHHHVADASRPALIPSSARRPSQPPGRGLHPMQAVLPKLDSSSSSFSHTGSLVEVCDPSLC